MKTQDENRVAWAAHIDHLRTMGCENVDPATLDQVEHAIRRFPYPSISDAVMQINGGWLCGLKYDLCLAWLLQNGCIEPSGFGVFRINRHKLPLVQVKNLIADGIDAASRQPEKSAGTAVHQPDQVSLFAFMEGGTA